MVTAVGLALLAAVAWAYLFQVAGTMGGMGSAAMDSGFRPWTAADFVAMFAMWAVMMVAMMVPSAAPMILLHARVQQQANVDWPLRSSWVFVAGYLTVWCGFSLLATIAQYALERAALVSPMMMSTSRWLGAAVLALAGAYQLTPLKQACLRRCRSPLAFVSEHWRPGVRGGWIMGLNHGAYCVGCCWFLMGLLFVGGVMNLLWIALISGFVLLEKLARQGPFVARATGVLLLAAALRMAIA